MQSSTDTIAAVATPPVRGGIGIVRVSGNRVDEVILAVVKKPLRPRHAHFLPFLDQDGTVLDSGIALYFPAPHSFTGEDILELHCHGSPMVMDLLLRHILRPGIRLARPGEFSERAFLNGKIDLIQAEAIADLIESSTETAARSAQRSLQGEFSVLIREMVDAVVDIRTYLEAAIDFSDEEIDFLGEGAVAGRLRMLATRLDEVFRSARQGSILREGMTVVIAGKPNTGKSSLLNRLAAKDLAIVTDIAGTTRDTLREYVQVDGMPLHVIDTAGLRESEDPVEREGIRRARDAIEAADRVLLLIDDREPGGHDELLATLPAKLAVTRVRNKIDLTGRQPGLEASETDVTIYLSVRTGDGMDLLREHLKSAAGYESDSTHLFTARRRHLDALSRARDAIAAGITQLESGGGAELIAEELRLTQKHLGEITGEFTPDDLLAQIFSSFCIGK